MRRAILKLLCTTPMAIGVVLMLGGANAMAIEEPKYDVVQTFAEFELRRYAPFYEASFVNPSIKVFSFYLKAWDRSEFGFYLYN